MHSEKLLNIYRALSPDIRKLYVFPHIERSSRFNQYLSLLYSGLPDAEESPSVAVRSGSFFSPLIVLGKIFGEKSVVHHHWFECRNISSLLNALWKLTMMALYRLSGGKIVWTVHNKYPHQRKLLRINVALMYALARLAHRLLVHCGEAQRIMAGYLRVSSDKFSVVEHPDYPVISVTREAAVKYLAERYGMGDLSERRPVFLMYGYIAPYKGNTEVMEMFLSDEDIPGVLVLAGRVKPEEEEYGREVERLASSSDRIYRTGMMIPDEDVAYFFGAADYLIFNFHRDILYSGGVHTALNYNKNIIVPDAGCFRELEGENILKFKDRDQLKSVLIRVSSQAIDHPD